MSAPWESWLNELEQNKQFVLNNKNDALELELRSFKGSVREK